MSKRERERVRELPSRIMFRNYTDILRRWNITEEDIEYASSFDLYDLYDLTDRGGHGVIVAGDGGGQIAGNENAGNGDEGNRFQTIQPISSSCYCDGVMRNLATHYKSYHGYAALMVCTFGTFTNILNIIVLTRRDTKATPINRILTGLATADVLVMVEYVPFAIYRYFVLPRHRSFPYGWAVFVLFHMHFTQLFHTISIALTLTLAVWRYIAIR